MLNAFKTGNKVMMRPTVRVLFAAALMLNSLASFADIQTLKVQGTGVGSATAKSDTQAKLMSLRAARIDAQRKLLAEIEGVQITGLTTVKDAMVESDVVATRIKGMLTGAFEVSSNTVKRGDEWEGTVEMAICLTSDSAQCRNQINLANVAKPFLTVTPKKDLYTAQDIGTATDKLDTQDTEALPHTGVVLDTRKFNMAPQLDIRVITNQGKELYGPGHVENGKDWLHWAASIEQAMALTNVVGSNPLTITELDVKGVNQVVLNNVDAARLFTENINAGDFLAEGKVIFIVSDNDP